MKKTTWTAVLGALLAAALVAAATKPAADVNAKVVGVWSGSSSNNYDFTLTLQETRGKLQGDFQVQGTDMDAENLHFDGTHIAFDLETQQGEYSLKGTVQGDSMSGTYTTDGDSGTWTATRGAAGGTAATGAQQQN